MPGGATYNNYAGGTTPDHRNLLKISTIVAALWQPQAQLLPARLFHTVEIAINGLAHRARKLGAVRGAA